MVWCVEEARVVEAQFANVGLSEGGNTSRIRVIDDVEELRDAPVTGEELRRRCVVVRASAAGDGDTVPVVLNLFPWMALWRDHPSWRAGAWRCVVDVPVEGPQYTGYRRCLLPFHSDMSRYARPPEFTVIRCVEPDPGNGGDNLVLHVDDVIDRLLRDRRRDVVDMLARTRVLNTEPRHVNVRLPELADRDVEFRAVIAVPDAPNTPSRVYDRDAATKGGHMELSTAECALLDEFVDVCGRSEDLAARFRLERGDVMVFSNWRMLHARTACDRAGRITEICMGNEPAAEYGLPDGVLAHAR
jgi:hypothetical protein